MSDKHKKSQKSYLGVGIAVGVAIGAAFGVALGHLALGMGCGIAVGIAIGLALSGNNQSRDKEDQSSANGNNDVGGA